MGDGFGLDLPKGVTLKVTSLSFPDDLDYELWSEVGHGLVAMKDGVQWALGDWWAYGDHAYGNRKKDVNALGKKLRYKSGSLMNLGTVSRRVPPSSRNEALSWSHHKVVAKFSPDSQRKWLEQAATNKWSVRQMQKMIRENRDLDENREERSAKIWVDDIRKKARHALQLGSRDAASYAGIIDAATVRELRTLAREVENAWKTIAEELEQFQGKPAPRRKIKRERLEDGADVAQRSL